MKTSAYLNFDGNCAEAFQFYAKTFPGKDLHIMKQGDMQKDAKAPEKDWVLHAYLKIGDAAPELLVISDTCFCEYTSHGHCGVIQGEDVHNDHTIENLARQAVVAAQAGADMVQRVTTVAFEGIEVRPVDVQGAGRTRHAGFHHRRPCPTRPCRKRASGCGRP